MCRVIGRGKLLALKTKTNCGFPELLIDKSRRQFTRIGVSKHNTHFSTIIVRYILHLFAIFDGVPLKTFTQPFRYESYFIIDGTVLH